MSSLFARAKALIENLSQAGDVKLKPDEQALTRELSAAHSAGTALAASLPGRRVVISSGNGKGYLVEIHDGDHFVSYGVEADNEADALYDASKRFEVERPEPQKAALPAPEPQQPEPRQPAADEVPTGAALDITRGRASNPPAPPAPTLTEKHLGDEQAKAQREAGFEPAAPDATSMSPMMEQGVAVSEDASNAQQLPVQTEADQNVPGVAAASPDQLQGPEPASEAGATLSRTAGGGNSAQLAGPVTDAMPEATVGDHLAEAERRAHERHEHTE